jgi:predicted dehydrogenase
MDKIKVAVVGTGGIANHHMGIYSKIEDIQVVAVCDIFKDKATNFAEKWGVPKNNVFTNYKKMMEMDEIQTVSVCTFNQAHAGPAIAALEAGKDVLCEKPMSAKLSDAVAMAKAAKTAGKILHIAIHSRYQPHIVMARKIVDAGILGDVYYCESVGCRRRGVPGGTFIHKKTSGYGAIVDIGVYNMHDTLFTLNYPKPVTVSGYACDYLSKNTPGLETMDVEEFGAAWVRFEDGSVMVFKISWAVHADSLGHNYFLGKKAGMTYGTIYADSVPKELEKLAESEGCTLKVEPVGNMVNIKVEGLKPVDVWDKQIREFLKAVREGAPSPIDPQKVIITNVIMDGITRSIKNGKEVKVLVPEI